MANVVTNFFSAYGKRYIHIGYREERMMSTQDELMRKREQWMSKEEKERVQKERIAREQAMNIQEKDVKNMGEDADNVRKIVSRYSGDMSDNILIGDGIPEKKLENAKRKYAHFKNDESPLILIDNTMFGSAKEGVLMTERTLYFKDTTSKPNSINLCDITSVKLDGDMDKKDSSIGLVINDVKIINGLLSANENKASIKAFIATIQEIIDQINVNAEQGSNDKVFQPAEKDWRGFGSFISLLILFSAALGFALSHIVPEIKMSLDYDNMSSFEKSSLIGQLVGGLVGVVVMFRIHPVLGILTIFGLIAIYF